MNVLEQSIRAATLAALLGLASAPALAGPYTILGSVNVAGEPTFSGQIAADGVTDRVFFGDGFGSAGVVAVNFSNPASPTVSAPIAGGGSGVAFNPSNNRFYSAGGPFFGGPVSEFSATTLALTQSSPEGITGCAGSLAVNSVSGMVYVTTQCSDTLHEYNPTTNHIVNRVALGFVGSDVVVNEATGNVYARHGTGPGYRAYNASLGFLFDTPTGDIQAANSVTNRLYSSVGGNLQVLDGSSHSLLATLTVAASFVAIDETLNRIFVTNNTSTVSVFDGLSNSLIDSISLGAGYSAGLVDVASDGRVYVVGQNGGTRTMFALGSADVPEPATALSLALGLAGLGWSRRRPIA